MHTISYSNSSHVRRLYIMCGIVGFFGTDNAVAGVIDGLEKLEYRGYDSVGIAYYEPSGYQCIKNKGRVGDLKKRIPTNLYSHLAIGHTRWATHGEPNQINAHPHYSYHKRFIIVHNGVIENYQKLKYEYLKKYEFVSETDTEIIVDLIEYFAEQWSVSEAIRKTMSLLEGSYSCLVLDTKDPKHLYFFKDQSPLLVGVGKQGIGFASDITGLVGKMEEYMVLEDKTFGIATNQDFFLYDMIGIKKQKVLEPITIQLEEINKKNYEHFMLKEIDEQPVLIRNLIHHYFKKDEVNIDIKLINKIKKCDKINFIACGTSMYACYLAKYYFEKLCGIPSEVFCASELVYSTPLISKKPFFIFLSQSGETADLIAVMQKIKKQKYPMLTITNTKESSMVRISDYYLDIFAGKEIAVASTKAYTGMIVVCAILARAVSGIHTNLKNNLKAVSLAMEKVLNNKELYKGIANQIKDEPDLFYIGRGIDYWTALEASLKLKEIAYIHTEAFSSGELKHGPIALIKKNTPVVAIITQEGTNLVTRSNLLETASRGAKTYVIASKSLSLPSDTIIIPNVAHYLSPLVSVIVVQLIAYYVAVLKNNDVDKPKNLAKSVTVQ